MRSLLFVRLIAAMLVLTAPAAARAEIRAPVTILVSIDGAHPSYLRRGATPHLDALAEAGSSARLRPSFPTKTFPNHHTIVTGLHPDRHGIVDNNMEDPEWMRRRFTLADQQMSLDPFWWGDAEPVWTTAERAGIRTATMFWPGAEVAHDGIRPSAWSRYDMNVTEAQRIETVLDWMRRPANIRPRFITLYFDTVDLAGHDHGPNSAEVRAAIREVDALLGRLIAGFEGLGQPADFVIVSDHGMAETSSERVVLIDDWLDRETYHLISSGAFLSLAPQPGREAELAARLATPPAHVQCWTRETLPARFLYGTHRRVPPHFCLADTGWLIERRAPETPFTRGMHGYDNRDDAMLGIFIASGARLARGAAPGELDAVDVYPLLARLIGVGPNPHQGDAAATAGLIP
jgi:predicted AlkP superfamily pyrophosphatase or phosphodiesterase